MRLSVVADGGIVTSGRRTEGRTTPGTGEPGTTVDVMVNVTAVDATVAELTTALLHRMTSTATTGDARLEFDGVALSPAMRLHDLSLHSGCVLRLVTGRESYDGGHVPASRHLVTMTQLAGPDSGRTAGLDRGVFELSRAANGPATPDRPEPVRIEVLAADEWRFVAGTEQIRVDGRPVVEGDSATGSVLVVPESAFRLTTARPKASRPDPALAAFTDARGRLPLIRTPRVAVPPPIVEVPVPEPPAPPASPSPVSWLLMLAPLPIGIVMAIVFSPFFLIMTTMTPLMGLARWLENRFRAKKDAKRLVVEWAAARARFEGDLDAARALVAATSRAAIADLGELTGRSRSGLRLWEVRPGDEDELRVCLGIGTTPWKPELGRRGDALGSELAGALVARSWLVDVPILVDLRERSGLGVVGLPDDARRTVAAVLLDLVTRHGPADLELALLVEPSRLRRWDWAKWLPHLTSDGGAPRVATDPDAAARLLARLDGGPVKTGPAAGRADGEPARPYTVVVVEGDDLLTGQVASLLERLARGRGRALVIASRRDRLPSVCRSFVEVGPEGTVEVTDAVTGVRVDRVVGMRAAPDLCSATARALARWTDPEQTAVAAQLPDRSRLVDLLLAIASGPEGPGGRVDGLDAATIGAWWRRGLTGIQATLGVTEHGPLTVDLLSDGPHGLVVGTTGAGKSELLRTLVASLACKYSPDDLTFLLVDFKGGGAFDACATLPHTVGMVTDLDEHLAARALRCLRAELRHRELRLREAGVSDLRDYLAPAPALPRLLIVIDEFATLAVELPGFLSALIDVAQRGRSLGIHLLLATQRPQGVVDGKIRANTNLRVALRVQDDADSRDVLGTRQAADIDRRNPGRAFVRLGAGEVVAVQTALVSAAVSAEVSERVDVTPFELSSDDREERAAPPIVDNEVTDLAALVTATLGAADAGDYEPPRVPWPPPLPDDIDAWTLPDLDTDDTGTGERPSRAGGAALGMVDLPDDQRADIWWWRPEAGGTVLLGADAAAVGAAVRTACLGLARARHPDRQKMFILDGVGYGLGVLAGLPHVMAAIGVDDTERVTRVFDLLENEVTRRRGSGGAGPEVLVVLAGWSGLVEGAEQGGVTDPATRLERLLRDGSAVGIRVLITAAHDRALPGRVLAQLPTKLCLRLADPSSYTGLGLRTRDIPDLHGLRAIDLHTQHEVQLAGYADPLAAVSAVAARYPNVVPPRRVGVLPDLVPAQDVLPASTEAPSSWRLAMGRNYRDLSVAGLALAPGMHVVVAGPPGSGRTTALRVLAAAARASAPHATIRVVAADPASWDRDHAVVGTFDELSGWPGEGRGMLLVDGIDTLGPAATTALDKLLATAGAACVVVVAGRPEAFRGMQPWQRAITLSRTGLLLRPTGDDGEVLRIRLPREAPPKPVPGRGYLVAAGGLAQIQTAFLPPLEPQPGQPPLPASGAPFDHPPTAAQLSTSDLFGAGSAPDVAGLVAGGAR